MEDRELIELAAKAAGVVYLQEGGTLWVDFGMDSREWNPLTDDGDALRLAVALKLTVGIEGDEETAELRRTQVTHPGFGGVCVKHGADSYAATRRAIVRAAAAIATAPAA